MPENELTFSPRDLMAFEIYKAYIMSGLYETETQKAVADYSYGAADEFLIVQREQAGR